MKRWLNALRRWARMLRWAPAAIVLALPAFALATDTNTTADVLAAAQTVTPAPPITIPTIDKETAENIAKIGNLVATKQWSLLFPLVLTLLAGLLKGPKGIQFISNVPPQYRALAVTGLGALLGTPALMAYGLSAGTAFLVALVASLAAPGAYEVWKGITKKADGPPATPAEVARKGDGV